MSTDICSEVGELTYENILKFVREYEEPVVTAGEVGDAFGVTNAGARYRLNKLTERDELAEKEVGSSAKVWYPVG